MRKKALHKDALKEITKSSQRFFSILAIVAIGIGFYAGVISASPDMKETVNSYFSEQNLSDIKVLTSLGITREDVDALKSTHGVTDAVGSYSKDMMADMNGSLLVTKVMSRTEGFNVPIIREGRLPTAPNECVVEKVQFQDSPVKIGDKVTLSSEDGSSISDTFVSNEFTVVGLVSSPQYISYSREKTSIGDGELDIFIIVPPESFNLSVFTEAYVKIDSGDSSCFSAEYKDNVENVKKTIENLGTQRSPARLEELKATAMEKWQVGYDEYAKNKNEFDHKIKGAGDTLATAKKELDTGRNAYNTGIENLRQSEISGKLQLQQAYEKLNDGELSYSNLSLISNSISAIKNEYIAGRDPSSMIDAVIQSLTSQLTSLPTDSKEYAALSSQISTLQNLKVYPGNKLDILDPLLSSIVGELSAARTSLDSGWNAYRQSSKTYEKSISDAKSQLDTAKLELDSGEKKYNDGIAQLNTQRIEGENKLNKAKVRLDESKSEIETLAPPIWYVFDRSVYPAYSEFEMNADRVESIAKVFPVFFVLIAMLVCLSAMTRMVEEQRVSMGTLKALGYKNIDIAYKYLIYAGTATILGCAVGLAVGFKLFPTIIYSAYSIMYILPPLITPFRLDIALGATIISLFCTLFATYLAIRTSLVSSSSKLMRPKSPKAGKKILLERWNFFWNHLRFNDKLTLRNLFRYKQRMFMTLIGIAGCTALMLTGFGVRDSITSIVDIQMGDIFRYDLVAASEFDETGESSLMEYLDNNEYIDKSIAMQTASMKAEKNGERTEISLMVPKDSSDFPDFISLRTRVGNDPIELADSGAVITEKIAETMGISIGDTINIEENTFTSRPVKITGICENYTENYLYLTSEYYEDTFKKDLKPNSVFIQLTESGLLNEKDVSLELFKRDDVLAVSSISTLKSSLGDAMKSLNLIVWVLIASAGALAFVVLYNLTTININERSREIATIKVLGFYPGEIYSYVFKENILLTLLGSGLGLYFGIWLTRFVISTAEMSNFMFSRNIAPMSFVFSFVLTILFSFIVNIVMRRKINRIDMVESLKSIE